MCTCRLTTLEQTDAWMALWLLQDPNEANTIQIPAPAMCAFSRLPKSNSKAEKHMLAALKERLLIANTWLRNAEEALG